MSKSRDILAVFNRGIISKNAASRVDVNRVALSAQTQTNWIPRVLGSMSLRPGTQFQGATPGAGIYIPFVFTRSDAAILEVTPSQMRIWDNGDTLLEAEAVTATITNGTFDSDLTGWTDADETGAASTFATGGYMQLLGTKYTEARRQQSVAITETGTVHRLRIVIKRGPLLLRVGTTAGGDDVFRQSVLRTGTHSIAFTPGASTIHIEMASSLDYPVLIDSVEFEAAGVVSLPAPWALLADCQLLRWQTINDVIFVACDGYQQRRIERRDNESWSIVLYEPNDGPFSGPSTDGTRLTPSAISGEITLTSSRSLFRSTSVGQLYRLSSLGQQVEADVSSEASFTDDIRITGVGADRKFTVTVAGTFTGTVTLQRSDGEPGSYVDVQSFTTATTTTINDGFDNSITFYRIGIKTGDYTDGTAELTLSALSGSITGVVRVTGYTSDTSVSGVVVRALGGTDATEIWEAGSWSETDGYPTAVVQADGRLWWFGRGRVHGSVADVFDSFDPDVEGDSGPINRSIGDGATDRINWALALSRLIVGSESAEHAIRSTSFDEPITPDNFNVKPASTQGSGSVPAVRFDRRGMFVQAGGTRLFEMFYDIEGQDYTSEDITALVPEIGEIGFTRISVQRQPDTRAVVPRSDGTVALLVRDKAEDVRGWIELETDGEVVEVAVLPGDIEDRVFYMVKRRINGADVYYHEEMQREDQCRGGVINRQADAAILYSGASTTVITGLDHLEGTSVVAWGDGKDLGSYTVSSGQITLSEAAANVWVGLTYRARYRSSRLAADLKTGLHMGQRGRIDHIGLSLSDTHALGLKYGPDFDTMDDMPLTEQGGAVDPDSIWDEYDLDMTEFPGDWSTDSRICLEANAPRPCTVRSAMFNIDRQERAIP